MSISELSDHSDIPVSTIKFYIRKDLLPGPVKTGRTRGYYTLRHLNRLKVIQKCKKDGNMALDRIREIVQVIDQEIEGEGGGIPDHPQFRDPILLNPLSPFSVKRDMRPSPSPMSSRPLVSERVLFINTF